MMEATDFVNILVREVGQVEPYGLLYYLENPPRRLRDPKLLRLSQWYQGLSETDKKLIIELLEISTDDAIKGVLCILDGSRVFEDEGRKSEFIIVHRKDGKESEINQDSILHELYSRTEENAAE